MILVGACSSPPAGADTTGGGGQGVAGKSTTGGAEGGPAGHAGNGGAGGVAGGAGAATIAGMGGSGTAGAGGAAAGGAAAGGGSAGAGGMAGSFGYEPIVESDFDEMPLFEGDPPNYKAGAPMETVNGQGSISSVSIPTLRRFAMDPAEATGFGYIVFPGGAYTGLDMDTHATRLAERLGPLGIAVFAVKYRVGDGSNDAPRDALLDAKRAIRMVKSNAARWGVVAEHVGVIGYSAGSHLALNLAANFDAGSVAASDPVEKESSRPAFVGSMSTWSFYEPTSPFEFPNGVPPVYFCHAQDDTLAPIALAQAVEAQIKAKGAATELDFYATGGHSTCHPGDQTMPGHDWPTKFWPWLETALP
jgi:acetyl esterase/lipase